MSVNTDRREDNKSQSEILDGLRANYVFKLCKMENSWRCRRCQREGRLVMEVGRYFGPSQPRRPTGDSPMAGPPLSMDTVREHMGGAGAGFESVQPHMNLTQGGLLWQFGLVKAGVVGYMTGCVHFLIDNTRAYTHTHTHTPTWLSGVWAGPQAGVCLCLV